MKKLLVLALFVASMVPVAASAQNLYINLKGLRVEDKLLGGGCALYSRSTFGGDKVRCTDEDGLAVYHWHRIQFKTESGVVLHTCEINVIKENHRAFRYRWHATIVPGSARCKMFWVNDNTLEVERGIR